LLYNFHGFFLYEYGRKFDPRLVSTKMHAMCYLLIQLLLQVLLHPDQYWVATHDVTICCKKFFLVIAQGGSSSDYIVDHRISLQQIYDPSSHPFTIWFPWINFVWLFNSCSERIMAWDQKEHQQFSICCTTGVMITWIISFVLVIMWSAIDLAQAHSNWPIATSAITLFRMDNFVSKRLNWIIMSKLFH
jgi:hypothetical protein